MSSFRRLIQLLVLRPTMFLLGLQVQSRANLDVRGPAIVVANHNSHLDTAALLAAVPNKALPRVHPAAAADYFLKSKLLAWISIRIIGIVPVDRTGATVDPLEDCSAALRRGEIVVIFPEGSRGEPGVAQHFKRGIAHLLNANPGVPLIPVHIEGAGRVLPKGSKVPVPLGIDVTVGEPMWPAVPMPIAETTRLVEEAVWNLAA
jgi:1-acyl-sn-glycerol-3-phosphate acyltransferase